MPIYCFICDECDETKEIHRPHSESDDLVKCPCGKDMRRDIQAEHGGHRATPGTYPYASYAMGVDAEDMPAQRAKDLAAGCHTDYNQHGEPIMRSKKHRKEYCRANGISDRNAGFSDPVPD